VAEDARSEVSYDSLESQEREYSNESAIKRRVFPPDFIPKFLDDKSRVSSVFELYASAGLVESGRIKPRVLNIKRVLDDSIGYKIDGSDGGDTSYPRNKGIMTHEEHEEHMEQETRRAESAKKQKENRDSSSFFGNISSIGDLLTELMERQTINSKQLFDAISRGDFENLFSAEPPSSIVVPQRKSPVDSRGH
jgi:hypothetical protein